MLALCGPSFQCQNSVAKSTVLPPYLCWPLLLTEGVGVGRRSAHTEGDCSCWRVRVFADITWSDPAHTLFTAELQLILLLVLLSVLLPCLPYASSDNTGSSLGGCASHCPATLCSFCPSLVCRVGIPCPSPKGSCHLEPSTVLCSLWGPSFWV